MECREKGGDLVGGGARPDRHAVDQPICEPSCIRRADRLDSRNCDRQHRSELGEQGDLRADLDGHLRPPRNPYDPRPVDDVYVAVPPVRDCNDTLADEPRKLLAKLGEGHHHRAYSRSVRAYYEARAPEYDDWYEGTGRFAGRDRPAWRELLGELAATLAVLAPAKTLDVGCGTGYATRWLPGEITGLDQSPSMLAIAAKRLPHARFVRGDAFALPFENDAFERVTAMSFYGHLARSERERFLAEARRVAPELVIVDAALREDVEPEQREERVLNDGSRWTVYKRFFRPEELVSELGGGRVLYDGRWFVAVASP
jgi:demethylmenaquinone methyltransferase/2-methoxy-6-polyprenyl-1,4-benzoquinol methylase